MDQENDFAALGDVYRRRCTTCWQDFDGVSVICPEDGTVLTTMYPEQLVGTVFADRYEIVSVIGEGGMGKVYKARHRLMRRMIAIKVVHPHLVSSQATLTRFQQESEAASRLNHPNIVTVHDFGLVPRAYMVMDYLDGVTLTEVLKGGVALSLDRSLGVFIQICAGLAHAHHFGVVHRDLKPSNIMLIAVDGKEDCVKIVDFGIAKLMLREIEESKHLTNTGEVFGSPLYMSPEQCRGKPMDTRSDIYSLGCIMYRTLTGNQPILGQELMECLYNHVNTAPRAFADVCPDANLPEALEAIVRRCMEKEQEQRFSSMLELKEALESLPRYETSEHPARAATAKAKPGGSLDVLEQTSGEAPGVGRVITIQEANRAASVVEARFAALAVEERLAASAAEAGRAASAVEESLVASAAETGRAASAAESARAKSAAEAGRAASAAEAERASSAAEAGRAANAAEVGRAASAYEASLAAFAAESGRVAAVAEAERAAKATQPGSVADAAEIKASASAAELGRSASAAEASRAANAAESARVASFAESGLVAFAAEAAKAASARESALAASAHEASLAASAHEAGLAASAAESVRAASAAEAGRAASAAEAGRAASVAEAGRAASAAEAGRIASTVDTDRAPSGDGNKTPSSDL